MTLDLNPLLENLEQRVVQEAPLKLIHARNVFNVFDKGNVDFHGSYGEWIGDQPLEGVKWNKNLTSADLDSFPEVFSCRLPIIHDKVYYTVYNKKVMKQALQSPENMSELSDRLVDSMKTKPLLDITKKLTEIICDKNNYKATAIKEVTAEELNIDSKEKAIKVLNWLYEVSNNMLEPSKDYNKGYCTPTNPNVFHDVETNSESTQSQVLVVDPNLIGQIETYFLSKLSSDSLINPRQIFKRVIPKKLVNNTAACVLDEKSLSHELINEDGIMTEQVFGSGNVKFGYHVTAIGGMISFTNAWMLRIKDDDGEESDYEETYEEFDLLKNYSKLVDKNKKKMNKKQAEEWSEADFSFAEVRGWVEAGLKISDAKFASWLKESGKDEFNTPEGYKYSVGQDYSTEEGLRKEFSEA